MKITKILNNLLREEIEIANSGFYIKCESELLLTLSNLLKQSKYSDDDIPGLIDIYINNHNIILNFGDWAEYPEEITKILGDCYKDYDFDYELEIGCPKNFISLNRGVE